MFCLFTSRIPQQLQSMELPAWSIWNSAGRQVSLKCEGQQRPLPNWICLCNWNKACVICTFGIAHITKGMLSNWNVLHSLAESQDIYFSHVTKVPFASNLSVCRETKLRCKGTAWTWLPPAQKYMFYFLIKKQNSSLHIPDDNSLSEWSEIGVVWGLVRVLGPWAEAGLTCMRTEKKACSSPQWSTSTHSNENTSPSWKDAGISQLSRGDLFVSVPWGRSRRAINLERNPTKSPFSSRSLRLKWL